jgi:type IV pilus assembly protein PilB
MTTKKTLLQYLLETGGITQEQFNAVQVERAKNPLPEEAVLKQMNFATDEQIAEAKSALFGIPYIDLRNMNISESVIAEVNIDGLKEYKAVPFERGKDYVKIAMADPFDIQATQVLEKRYPQGTRVQVYITTEESVQAILDRRMGDVMSSEVTEALEMLSPTVEINEIKPDTVC